MEDPNESKRLLDHGHVAIDVDGPKADEIKSNSAMHLAADMGEEEQLLNLVQRNKDEVGKQDESGRTPLHLAAKGLHLRCCEILLGVSTKEIKIQDKSGNTPLMLAITSGNTAFEVAKLLISKGAKVGVANQQKQTPLHIAAEKGSSDICQLILQNDERSINAQNKEKQSPLHFAAMNGYANLCQFLVRKGANLEDKDVRGFTALHYAAKAGFTECCNQLLSLEASVNCIDKNGNTPLHLLFSSKKDKPNCVEVLCNKGANVSAQNKDGVTPFHLAQHAPSGMMEKLLALDLNPLIIDKNGKTVLHWAAERRSNKHTDLLLKMEIWKTKDTAKFINIQDRDGHTALHAAIMKGSKDDCKLLMKHGADVNVMCRCHGTVLHLAAEKGLDDMCDFLQKYIKVNSKNSKSLTPLHIAAKADHKDCCEVLIKHKASNSAEDSEGNTPLHTAANEGNAESCALIMKTQPSLVNKKNKKGHTPLHLAVLNGSLTCCKALVRQQTQLWTRDSNIPSAIKLAYDNYDSSIKNENFNYRDIFIYLLHSSNKRHMKNIKDIEFRDILREQIIQGNSEMVSAILDSDFGEEALLPDHKSDSTQFTKNENFRLLVQHLPRLARKVLDMCQDHQDDERHIINVRYLDEVYISYDNTAQEKHTGGLDDEAKLAYDKVITPEETLMHDVRILDKVDHVWYNDHVLMWMLRFGRKDLVEHPIVTYWLNHKWKRYVSYGHYLSVCFALILAISLTVYNALSMDWALLAKLFTAPITQEAVCVNFTVGPEVVPYLRERGYSAYVLGWAITVYVFVLMAIEIYKIIKLRWMYFKMRTFIQWVCMTCSFLFIRSYTSCSFLTLVREDVQWLAGLAAIILAWLHFFILAWIHPRNPFVFNFKRFLRAVAAIGPPIVVLAITFYAVAQIGSKGSLSYSKNWEEFVTGLVSLPMIGTAVVVGLSSFIYLDSVSVARRIQDKTLRRGNIEVTLEFDLLYPFLRKRYYTFWIERLPKDNTKSHLRNLWRIFECGTEGDDAEETMTDSSMKSETKVEEMYTMLKNIESKLIELNSKDLEKQRKEEEGETHEKQTKKQRKRKKNNTVGEDEKE